MILDHFLAQIDSLIWFRHVNGLWLYCKQWWVREGLWGRKILGVRGRIWWMLCWMQKTRMVENWMMKGSLIFWWCIWMLAMNLQATQLCGQPFSCSRILTCSTKLRYNINLLINIYDWWYCNGWNQFQAEQEEIIRNRPPGQKGLTLKEIRKMDYVNKVYIYCSEFFHLDICMIITIVIRSLGNWWNASCCFLLIDGVQRGKERCECLW